MGLMKKLTSALVASSLVLSLVGSAFAAYTPGAGEAAGTRMQKLGIIQGRDGGDLALNSEITRAELVTTIVRAFGQEENAKYLKGSTIFPDIANHWASGNIAMAVALVEKAGGDAIGMPDGTFAPDVKLTPAQAVAFLMKFIGLKADATKAWPANYLDVAADKGLITAEDKALIAAETGNATRGLTFYVFDNAFYNYKLADGKTFYTKYVAPNGPTLTMNDLADTTMDSKVTVTGNAKGAVEVYVGSTKVTPDASGNFTAEFALPEVKAEPYTVTVTAIDLAGNRVEKSDTIARVVGNIASVEAAAITVAAGATVDVAAVAKDEAGNVIADAAITGESAVGTFADGKFTAGKVAGEGTLTLKAGEKTADVKVTITAGAMAAVTPVKASVAKGEMVKFEAKDAYGNVITGATFTQTSADVMLDSTTGNFMASATGNFTVTATKDGVSVEGTVGVYSTTAAKLVVSAPTAMVGNDETAYEVTVTAVDANGNLVATYDKNITISGEFTAAPNTVLTKKASAGVATFKVVADDANRNTEIDVDATSNNGTKDITGTASVNVVAQVPTALKIDAPKYLTVNDGNAQGTVYVVDQMGEVMVGVNSWTVTLNVTGPAYLTSDDKTTTTVVATGVDDAMNFTLYPVDETSVGNVTVTATFTGFESATSTTTAAYGLTANKLVVENVSTDAVKASDLGVYKFKVTLTDKNGVPRVAAAGGETVTLKFNTDKFAELNVMGSTDSADLTAANVTAAGNTLGAKTTTVLIPAGESAVYVGVSAWKYVGTVDFDATGTDLTKATGTVAFKAGDADSVVFTRTDAIDVLTSAPEATLTAKVLDAAGNNVPKADVKVKFFADSYAHVKLNGAAADYKTVTDANGQATVKVNIMPYNENYVVKVAHDIDADDAYADTETLTLNMKAAISNSISLQTWAEDNSGRKSAFEAGEKFNIRAYVKDNNGLVVNALAIEDTLALDGLDLGDADVVEAAVVWTLVAPGLGESFDPYYQATLTARKAGSFTFTVAETSVAADVKANRTINVTPGTFDQIVVEQENSVGKLDIDKGTVKAFTVRIADTFGNLVSPTQVSAAVKFDVTFANSGATGAGTYYDVRTSETSGTKLTGWSIGAGTNSKTMYLVTNDVDDAEITFTVTNPGELPVGFEASTTYTVTVAQ